MPTQPYDLVVVGAGPAGSGAAVAAAEQGRRVALIEPDKIGGTCLNYGCDPTKILLHSAHVFHQACHAERYGLRIPTAKAEWPQIQACTSELIDQMRGGSDVHVRMELTKRGIEVFKSVARLLSAHEIAVDEQVLRADQIIIASGSQVAPPDIPGLRDTGFITNKQAIRLPQLPRRLAIIGGGSIGIQFAQMFHRFGVAVMVLEQAPEFLPAEDRELAELLCELLAHEGICIETGVERLSVRRDGVGKQLTYSRHGSPEITRLVDEILIVSKFKPVLDLLDPAAAGVQVGERGIVVDDTLRTTAPNIWAAGDVIGRYKLTHVAYDQGRLAAFNAFAAEPLIFDERVIPWVIYTAPELAHVGQTEEQLRAAGIGYRVGRKPMSEVERAVANQQTEGLTKLLIGEDGSILGGHILGASAGELIAPIVLAMRAGLPADMLATTRLPYPTLAEGVRWAAESAIRDLKAFLGG